MKPLLVAGSFVIGLAAWAAAAPRQAPPSATDLARQLQQRYATVRDFTADFTQTAKDAFVSQTATERGTVRVRKPGCMYWRYEAPEKKDVVSDGAYLRVYIPADRSGTRMAMPTGDDVSTAMLFLTGKGDLVRDFTATLPSAQAPGEWRLALVPRRKQADFETLALFVERQTLKLTGLLTVDDQGSSTIRFSHLRENVGLGPDDFTFKFPRGTDVEDIR